MLMNGDGGVIINTGPGPKENTLVRGDLTASSGGTYTCRASNGIGIGVANASTEVIIQGRHAVTTHTPSHCTHPHNSHTLTQSHLRPQQTWS